MSPATRALKRAMDVVAGAAGLVVSAPIVSLLAVAIKLDSEGPLFYRQIRAGELLGRGADGQPLFREFEMLKLRTMIADAERESGAVLARAGDARVTRVGRFLRKTRLDELPQLWHVLRGEMSLVGPRPERPELLANLALAIPFFEERMRNVKPGITGLAQVSLGYAGEAAESSAVAVYREVLTNPFKVEGAEGAEADGMRLKLLFDLAYVAALEHFGSFLRTELSIIARTPLVMLRGLGT